MKRIAFAVLLSPAFAVFSSAQDMPESPLPLYDAFQTFCVKTKIAPDAVAKAIAQAGGTSHRATPSEQQFPMMKDQTRSRWDVTVEGHVFTVSMVFDKRGMIVLPNPTTSCLVMSSANEDDSITAITSWVGVPSAQDFAGLARVFQYEEAGDHRTALPVDKRDREAAVKKLNVIRKGQFWTLTVMGGKDSASVILLHALEAPASQSAVSH